MGGESARGLFRVKKGKHFEGLRVLREGGGVVYKVENKQYLIIKNKNASCWFPSLRSDWWDGNKIYFQYFRIDLIQKSAKNAWSENCTLYTEF